MKSYCFGIDSLSLDFVISFFSPTQRNKVRGGKRLSVPRITRSFIMVSLSPYVVSHILLGFFTHRNFVYVLFAFNVFPVVK